MNKSLQIVAILSILLFSACKKTNELTTAKGKKMSVKQLTKQIKGADFNFDFFSAKARVNFNNGVMNQNFTANMRIQKNETIWMSLTGPFGIEGARVLIKPDRIQVINRLNGEYIDQPLTYLNNYIPFPIDFSFIETVLVGNSFNIAPSGKQKLKLVPNFYELQESEQGINAQYLVDFDYKYAKARFEQQGEKRQVDLNYSDYKSVDNQLFAFFRELLYSDKAANNDLAMTFKFSRVKKESALDFPFKVPEKYKN